MRQNEFYYVRFPGAARGWVVYNNLLFYMGHTTNEHHLRHIINMKRILTLLTTVTLAACASWGKGGNETTEQLLAAAGFKIYYPRDAQEQANLKNIPQHQLVSMRGAVKPTYLYADADDGECDCVYVGGDDQLKEYRRLNGIKRGADGAVLSAEMRENYMTGGGMMGMGGVMGGYW